MQSRHVDVHGGERAIIQNRLLQPFKKPIRNINNQ
jgi:hypothetical protein